MLFLLSLRALQLHYVQLLSFRVFFEVLDDVVADDGACFVVGYVCTVHLHA